MRIRKLLSVFLILTLVITTFGSVPVSAQTSNVGYLLTGSEENGRFILNIYVQNVRALSGRIAVSFDNEKLRLADITSLENAIHESANAYITSAGIDSSLMLSNSGGRAMFAWYSSKNSGIDATAEDQLIASIPFYFTNGATMEDFTRNTISLYYVNPSMIDRWDSSAAIVSYDLEGYTNNSRDDAYLCNMVYDYPNCNYIPTVTYKTTLTVTDYNSNPIPGATVSLDYLTLKTNAAGEASFDMENGVYAYRVCADGYETHSAYVIVNDDVTVNIPLMSHAQIARATADNLKIGFADGDDASNVTVSLTLPQIGEYGETITWKSSNPAFIDNSGVVIRSTEDETVTLTATVSIGDAAAEKSFNLTVKSKLTADEKNTNIVLADISSLNIGYSSGDSSTAVTAQLQLPQVCPGGSAVMWTSSNEDIISAYGDVTRPEENTEVTLTAHVMRGNIQRTKSFTVTVVGTHITIIDDGTANNQTGNSGTGQNNNQNTDINNNPNSNTNTNTTPLPAPTPGTDTSIQIDTSNNTVNASNIVNTVANNLKIIYSDGDSPSHVTNQMTLPVTGAYNTVIDWTSSDPLTVTSYGAVVRQKDNKTVTLTATVRNGNTSVSKQFTVTVLAAPTTPVVPDNGQEQDILNGISASSTANADATPAPQPSATPPVNGPQNNENIRFTDLTSVPWAKDAILSLASRGIINGTSADTYSPQDNIRRADFVILLTKLFNLDGEISESFDDVTPDKYYYSSVSLAKSLGIISGVGENIFNPEGSITRQDMMTMTFRALKALDKAPSQSDDLSRFHDADNISDYARQSVQHLVGAGFISGDDKGNVNPKSNTTRAQTAVFLYKIGG